MPAFAEDATGVTAKTAKLRRRVAEYCLEKMSGVNATLSEPALTFGGISIDRLGAGNGGATPVAVSPHLPFSRGVHPRGVQSRAGFLPRQHWHSEPAPGPALPVRAAAMPQRVADDRVLDAEATTIGKQTPPSTLSSRSAGGSSRPS